MAALDFSKLNILKRLDARGRVFFLLAAVVVLLIMIYLFTRWLSGSSSTTGASHVASAPAGLQSVQGGQLTPEYERALQQANTQSAQQAQMTGGSAVPTVINYGMQGTAANCNIICSDQNLTVKALLDEWVKQGSVSPEVAAQLEKLADDNVPVMEFANTLDDLVKQGKLTPEQARQLLDVYRKQHINSLVAESAKAMDILIKTGDLSINDANHLLDLQKKGVSPADYATELQNLVAQGKITPAVAQQLLAQYTKQRAAEAAKENLALIKQMQAQGEVTPDVAKDLSQLVSQGVPIDQYNAELQKLVAEGKLTPAAAAKLLAAYASQKSAVGPVATVNRWLQESEAAAYKEISDLLGEKKITPEVAEVLRGMLDHQVTMSQFQGNVSSLVEQKKLTPEIAKLKLADYKSVSGLRALAARLAALQAANAPPSEVAAALRDAVAEGIITPEQAAELMKEYEALHLPSAAVPTVTGPANSAFAQLQQRVQQNQAAQPGGQGLPTAEQFAPAAPSPEENTQAAADRAARIAEMLNAMSAQAGQLVASWQPPVISERAGTGSAAKAGAATTPATTAAAAPGAKAGTSAATGTGALGATTPPIIKAGTILFAVLDTEVNSDYPDSPVMATIVAGEFKGAKLLGKLAVAKNVAGQMDRVSLNFTMMNEDVWPDTKNVTAYAIDPDTARTVLATSVNYHYLMRFGAIMATSFLQGFSSAVTSSGSTISQGFTGTTTANPSLTFVDKLTVGLGQVGQNLGSATQNWVNIPPTVRVAGGVGLGILFMSDVT